MKPEIIVAKEAAILLKRNPSKYTRGIAGMYLLSARGIELGSTSRSSYYFVRHVDDVLDGDRQVSCDPLGYVQDLRSQVETGNFRNGMGIATLAKHAISNLERKKKPGDNPRLDFLRAIDGIIFDYERSRERKILTSSQLEDYYHLAFDPVIDLTLMILDSSLRSRDIPVMSYGQGRVYSVRDLRADWTKGVINIPRETLERAGLSAASDINDVESSIEVHWWFNTVLASTRPELIELQTRLKALSEGTTSFILGGLIGPMLRFINGYEKSFYSRGSV